MGRRRIRDTSDTSINESPKGKSLSKYKCGRLTKIPFFNFLRDMKRKSHGMDIREVAIKGAELWSKMDKHQKKSYCQLARQSARRRRRGRRRRGRRRRRRGRRRRRSYRRSSSQSPTSRSRSRTRSRSISHGSRLSQYSAHDSD